MINNKDKINLNELSLESIITSIVLKTSTIISIILALIYIGGTVFFEISSIHKLAKIEHQSALANLNLKMLNIEASAMKITKFITNSIRYDPLTKKLDAKSLELNYAILRQIIDSSNGLIDAVTFSVAGLEPIVVVRTAIIASTDEKKIIDEKVVASFQLTSQQSETSKIFELNINENKTLFIQNNDFIYPIYRGPIDNQGQFQIRVNTIISSNIFSDYFIEIGSNLKSLGYNSILRLTANGQKISQLGLHELQWFNPFESRNKSILFKAIAKTNETEYFFESSLKRNSILINLLFKIFLSIVAGGVFVFTTWWVLKRQLPKVTNPLKQIVDDINVLEKNKFEKSIPIVGPIEIISVRKSLEQMRKKIIEFSALESKTQLASQVAHDIRSPLSALTMVAGTLLDIPEEKRIMIRNATQRINDIANDLLQKGKEKSPPTSQVDTFALPTISKSIEFIPAIVDVLVSEKRTQFREHNALDIQTDLKSSFGAFSEINSAEFKRVLSNLINNAVESFENYSGRITVGVKKLNTPDGLKVEIFVVDNGKGIPAHIISKLGQKGVSYGKSSSQSGTGLGIYHAKQTAEAFGGNLEIHSIAGAGSTIKFILPQSEVPMWFTQKIDLTGIKYLISLDDDTSIHQIWANRLKSLNIETIEHIKFQSGDAFEKYFFANINKLKETLFLVDFELLKQSKTGLDLIEELAIEKYSILITSRYEDKNIQERASRIHLRLLPKSLAGVVPFGVLDSKND